MDFGFWKCILMPAASSQQLIVNSGDTVGSDYETSLIERLKRKDSKAFQELIDLHGDSIRNLVGRLMAFDPEMEDVLQNTMVQVWRKIGSFRNQSSLKTWITRIAITQSHNHQRSVRRWMRRIQDRWKMENPGTRYSCNVERQEDPRWELIQAAMKKLPYRDREILVLVYLQGNTVQELARTMNEKANTLEVRLHRAKKLLNRTIKEASEES